MSRQPKKTISTISTLMLDWSAEDNPGVDPTKIGVGSHRPLVWKCSKCGRKWTSIVSNRARLKRGCPYCSHQRVIPGETDLATKCPDLALEWDKTKNGCSPSSISAGSHNSAWWKCRKCGYEWQAQIKSRASGVGCPVCSNRKIIAGLNDLATTHPDVAAMWHPTKNGKLTPQMISHGSGKPIWWMDEYGNEFQAKVFEVTRPEKPQVGPRALRTSFPEQAVFFYIKKRFPDAINGYQDIFRRGMELDVYVPSIKTGIEYDGWWHRDGGLDRERKKYQICKRNGISLIRIKENREHWEESHDLADYIVRTIPGVYFYLEKAIRVCLSIMGDVDIAKAFFDANSLYAERPNSSSKDPLFDIYSSIKGPDVTIDINIKRDKKQIQNYLRAKVVSLKTKFPEIAEEWAYDLNDQLRPEAFHPGSGEKVWWRCKKCGHEWKTAISERTGPDHTGCPKCARLEGQRKRTAAILKERGSLASNCPDLLSEWDYEKNIGIDPEQLTTSSNLPVWWTCKRCGNSWQTAINHRSKGEKCPYCQNKKIKPGFNDLATLYPEVVLDWDFTANGDLKPTELAPKSGKPVHWLCHVCGHHWTTSVSSRTSAGSGCPNCWNVRRRKKQ